VTPDFDHIDEVFWSIPKLLTVTESPNPRVVHQDLVRLTLVTIEMKFRGWMHRVERQACGIDRQIWSATMPRYKILGSPKISTKLSLPDFKFSVQDGISVGLRATPRGKRLSEGQMSP
jgi:hypothetical protein